MPNLSAYHYSSYSIPTRHHSRYDLARFHLLLNSVSQFPEFTADSIQLAAPVSDEVLETVHSKSYIEAIRNGFDRDFERQLGFPWSEQLFTRVSASVGCAIQAAKAAHSDGLGIVLGGGAHHAFSDHGEGYCVFNDIAIAAHYILRQSWAERVGILDCDVHQGNGTASIAQNFDNIVTCSVHAEKNFPFQKVKSDYDIGLPDGCRDELYLEAVKDGYRFLIEEEKCDFLLYVGGADPYIGDSLGRLHISKRGLRLRDEFVGRSSSFLEIPLLLVLGGGYAKPISDTVSIQATTIEQLVRFYHRSEPQL